MKLHLTATQGLNLFTAHGDGAVSVNGQSYPPTIAVLPDRVLAPWTTNDFQSLTVDDFAVLAALEADIVLLGTGSRGRFPAPALITPLILAGRGLEVMDTAAACRTYNILAGEGRRVVAALLAA